MVELLTLPSSATSAAWWTSSTEYVFFNGDCRDTSGSSGDLHHLTTSYLAIKTPMLCSDGVQQRSPRDFILCMMLHAIPLSRTLALDRSRIG